MSIFKDVVMPVPAEAIKATQDMNGWDRRAYMMNHHLIPDHHRYGYGVYGDVTIIDETHIGYQIGSSCD